MAGEAPIRLRIGASLEASVDRAFATIERRADKAQIAVRRGQRQTATSAEKEAQREARAKEKAAKEIERAAARMAKAQEREAARLVAATASLDRQRSRALMANYKAEERAAAQKEAKIRAELEKTAKAAQRAMDRERRQQARRDSRVGESFAQRVSHRATRFLMPNAPLGSMARRLAGDVASGLGVDTNFGTGLSRSVALEQEAIQLSNSAYQEKSTGPANKRADPRALVALARQQADEAGMDPGRVMSGLREFVGRTGDLATGQAALPGLLKLAKATGADPADVLSAAGTTAATVYKDLAGSLEDAGERAKFLFDVMNVGAGGGKLGTVEFEHLASQGPKLAAAAQAFGGDKSKNLAEMFALAQLGLSGGAASPTQAGTSVAAMVNTLRTPARRGNFAAAGVTLEDDSGKFRSASDIIIDSIVAAGKDTEKFKTMWANVQGARSVEGLRQLYLEKGGGDEGVAALRGKFRELGAGAALSDKELSDSFAAAMASASTKAQRFQNNLDKIVEKTANSLLPALDQLAPSLLQLAEVLGRVTTWVVENPKLAIGAAISTSIARAIGESALRTSIESMIVGPQGKAAAAAGKFANVLGGAGLAASTFATTFAGTTAIIEAIFQHFQDEQRKVVGMRSGATNAESGAYAGEERARKMEQQGVEETPEQLAARRQQVADAIAKERNVGKELEDRPGILRSLGDALLMPLNEHGKGGLIDTRDKREAEDLRRSKLEIAKLEGILRSIDQKLGGELKVSTTGAEPPGRVSQGED